MAVETTLSENGRDVVIRVTGRFDFSALEDLNHAFEQSQATSATYIVDMSKAEDVRDSGLALLLMIRERLANAVIKVINCRPEALRILRQFALPREFQFQ
jgi:ABC-type transporter Mla MlaB component